MKDTVGGRLARFAGKTAILLRSEENSSARTFIPSPPRSASPPTPLKVYPPTPFALPRSTSCVGDAAFVLAERFDGHMAIRRTSRSQRSLEVSPPFHPFDDRH